MTAPNNQNKNISRITAEKKLLGFIGLAKRAGRLVSGEDKTLEYIKSERCSLVILAFDAAEGTKKKLCDKCSFYKRELIEFSDKVSLGNCVGKPFAAVLAITDEGFASQIKQRFSELGD